MKLSAIVKQAGATRHVELLLARSRAMWPAARKVGEYVARHGKRNAPRGTGVLRRQGSSLANLLSHVEPAHNVTVLTSPLPYARIQNTGGTITAGSGRLHSQYL